MDRKKGGEDALTTFSAIERQRLKYPLLNAVRTAAAVTVGAAGSAVPASARCWKYAASAA